MGQAIEIEDLAFTWPGRAGFSLRVSALQVPSGERLFLKGRSGSGKSTLLSLIAGIAVPDRGRIAIDGTDLGALRPAARDRFRAERLGVIFQQFNLLPYASPLENILLPLSFGSARRKSVRDPRREALRLTAALGLEGKLVTQARASELSIGQQQRVAAARALIGGPKLVIADEPTSALDADSQGAFIELLMGQVAQAGATLLMVSHDARLAHHFDRSLDLAQIAVTEGAAS